MYTEKMTTINLLTKKPHSVSYIKQNQLEQKKKHSIPPSPRPLHPAFCDHMYSIMT